MRSEVLSSMLPSNCTKFGAASRATMQYVKEHTSIPVPDVLFYDPDWDRKVGGEWMLMRYVSIHSYFCKALNQMFLDRLMVLTHRDYRGLLQTSNGRHSAHP